MSELHTDTAMSLYLYQKETPAFVIVADAGVYRIVHQDNDSYICHHLLVKEHFFHFHVVFLAVFLHIKLDVPVAFDALREAE